MCNTSTLLRLIIIILTQNYSACNHFINRDSFQCVLKHCFKRYYLVSFFAIFLLTSSQLMFIIFHSHKIFLKITPSIGQIFFREGHLTQITQAIVSLLSSDQIPIIACLECASAVNHFHT